MAYAPVHRHIWQDDKFRALTEQQRLIFLYLLTSPHGNMAGCYYLNMAYAEADTGCTREAILRFFDTAKSMVIYDPSTSVLLIKHYLRWNTPGGSKQLNGVLNAIKTLPKTWIINEFIACAVACDPGHSVTWRSLSIQYPYPIDTVSIPYRYCIDSQSTGQDRTEQDRTEEGAGAGTGSDNEEANTNGTVPTPNGPPPPPPQLVGPEIGDTGARPVDAIAQSCQGYVRTLVLSDKDYRTVGEWVRDGASPDFFPSVLQSSLELFRREKGTGPGDLPQRLSWYSAAVRAEISRHQAIAMGGAARECRGPPASPAGLDDVAVTLASLERARRDTS